MSVKPERAADAVARHIEKLILEGSLHPDERLLPERELAAELDVSRPTLRDALRILERKGLLAGTHGRGVRVAPLGAGLADPLIALLAEHAELADDYLEFRDIVESSAARLAADRATEVDLARLGACLARIEHAHAADDPMEEAEADAALHLAIYEASHNVVLLQIMRALSATLRRDVMQNRAHMFTIPSIRELLCSQHRAIAAAILARDPEAAAQAAHEHLAYLRRATRGIREAEAKLELSKRRHKGGGLTARASAAGGLGTGNTPSHPS